MSLINDALKRAKKAQDQAAPGAERDLELRPVEAGSVPQRKAGWVLPSVVTAAVFLAAFCIYEATRPSPPETQVQARTTVQNTQTPITPVAPTNPPETTSTKPVVATNIPATATAPQHSHEQSALAIPPEHTTSNTVATSVATTEVAATPPQAPIKPTFKLQGIVFHPTRPSAVINGKTVFVGDKIADKRVFAIGEDTVTVAGSGGTNVLTLP